MPLYRQIASRIKEDIILSNLGKDEAILPENKLAEKYKVSRVTIRRAIDLLVKEGILYRIQGSGTYVKTEKINHDIYKLQGFTEEMLQLQQNPINKILEFRLEYPDRQVRDILHLKEDER
nr:transcriptional regulator [Bacillaceae bacterium]